MTLGMNSNRAEDMMAGKLLAFFLSCILFTAVFFLGAKGLLAKRDVRTQKSGYPKGYSLKCNGSISGVAVRQKGLVILGSI